MGKRKRLIVILAAAVLLAGLAARLALGAVLADLTKLDRAYAVTVNAPERESVLSSQTVTADLVSIGLDVERLETKDFRSERFGLTVTLENRTPVQYRYVVSLDALGMDGLIPAMPKADRTALTYSGNYPDSGKNGGDGPLTCYFEPEDLYGDDREVGSVYFTLERNIIGDEPLQGVVGVRVTAYLPVLGQRVGSFTQQIPIQMGRP